MASSSNRTHILPLIDNWKHFLGLTKYLVDWIFIKKKLWYDPLGRMFFNYKHPCSILYSPLILLEELTLSSSHKSLWKQKIFTVIHTFFRSRKNKKAFSTSGQQCMQCAPSTANVKIYPPQFSSTNLRKRGISHISYSSTVNRAVFHLLKNW